MVYIKESQSLTGFKVVKPDFIQKLQFQEKRDLSIQTGPYSAHKMDGRGFIAKEQGDDQWMENY